MFDSVRLELTGRCDMKCLYCHAGEKNTACYCQDELSHDRWLEIIQECKNLGVKNFIFTGGEPFLYRRWPELVEACGSNVQIVISTNGKHFSEANLAVLSNFQQVKEFRTSIDGLPSFINKTCLKYLCFINILRMLVYTVGGLASFGKQ